MCATRSNLTSLRSVFVAATASSPPATGIDPTRKSFCRSTMTKARLFPVAGSHSRREALSSDSVIDPSTFASTSAAITFSSSGVIEVVALGSRRLKMAATNFLHSLLSITPLLSTSAAEKSSWMLSSDRPSCCAAPPEFLRTPCSSRALGCRRVDNRLGAPC